MMLFRRGRITLDEAERQLDDVEREASTLRQMSEALGSQTELAKAFESHLSKAASMLERLQGRLEEIDRDNDLPAKRQVIDLLLVGITVNTIGEGRTKTAEVDIRYAFAEPHVIDTRTPHPSGR